jgi:carbohydrate-binding DOMON domain-containing protein
VIGFNATHRLHFSPTAGSQLKGSLQTWNDTDQVWQANAESGFTFRSGASGMEIAVPLADLSSNLDSGDSLLFRIATPSDLLPASAPGRMQLPDLGRTTWVVDINDPSGDDHGPGEYTYPTDAVFKPGVFDLLNFKVGYDENNLVFRVEMRGPVENPWGSPNGLAIQLIDIYLDTYGVPSGNRMLRNGRNAALTSAYGWDYVLTLAGWNYGVFTAAGPETVSDIPLTIITDPVKNVILAKIPLTSIPGDPTSWYYTVAVLSNDGYGINWVRDVTPDGGQWIVGGSRMDTNHTRILDLLWPEGLTPSQETQLSIYTSSQADPASLSPDDFPQVLGYPPIP